jgi:Crp-like helix-turn-helix domain
MNNISHNIPARQQKNNKVYSSNPNPAQKYLKSISKNISTMRAATQLTLDYLLRYKTKYKRLFMSQQTIADEIGYSREEVNKSLRELKLLGLISVWFRSFNTCYYWISNCFNNLRVRHELSILFPFLALSNVLILSLLSQPAINASDHESHTIYKLNFSPSVIYNQAVTSKCKGTSYEEIQVATSSKLAKHKARTPSGRKTYNEATSEVLLRSARTHIRSRSTVKKESMFQDFNFSSEQAETFSVYPEIVIRQAVITLKKMPHIREKFHYLHGICKRISEEVVQKNHATSGYKALQKRWTKEELDEVTRKETLKRKSLLDQYVEKNNPQRERQNDSQDTYQGPVVKEDITRSFSEMLTDEMKEDFLLQAIENRFFFDEHPGLKPILADYLRRRPLKVKATLPPPVCAAPPPFIENSRFEVIIRLLTTSPLQAEQILIEEPALQEQITDYLNRKLAHKQVKSVNSQMS